MVDIKFHCDEKSNFYRGFSARAFTYTDYSIEMHNHNFFEVNIVLSGSGTHHIENGSFKVSVGDVFVIPPMVAHSYTDTDGLEVYHILLQKSFIDRNRAEVENVKGFLLLTETEPLLRSNFSNAMFLHLDRLQMPQIRDELKIIDDNGIYSWEECFSMKYHTIWKLLYLFSFLLNKQANSDKHTDGKGYEIQIMELLEYMHKHYSEKITVDTLCKRAFLSRSTFLREFKKACNASPIEYLNRYRCKKAIEQLSLANCSKTEIAHRCGFYDLSHMERSLKKYR